jgi:uncharacterized membrane protein
VADDERKTVETFSLMLHITAAAVLVGPQVLMFLAVVPATWLIEDDEQLKRRVLKVVAGRFGMLATASIVVLVLTGLYQYFTVLPPEIRANPNAYAFGPIFSLKMILFTALLLLIYIHTYRFSRRIADLSDRVIDLESAPSPATRAEGRQLADELERARQRSFGFSVLVLGVSILTLWVGVALGSDAALVPLSR